MTLGEANIFREYEAGISDYCSPMKRSLLRWTASSGSGPVEIDNISYLLQGHYI
jgi:hypothetical protein